jgi:hypothetical protein
MWKIIEVKFYRVSNILPYKGWIWDRLLWLVAYAELAVCL